VPGEIASPGLEGELDRRDCSRSRVGEAKCRVVLAYTIGPTVRGLGLGVRGRVRVRVRG
jgi:hypothetical protein